jgi:hypothetical protein
LWKKELKKAESFSDAPTIPNAITPHGRYSLKRQNSD